MERCRGWFTSDLERKTFLKPDATSVWIEVKPEELFDPRLSVQYVYKIYSSGLVVNVGQLTINCRQKAIK